MDKISSAVSPLPQTRVGHEAQPQPLMPEEASGQGQAAQVDASTGSESPLPALVDYLRARGGGTTSSASAAPTIAVVDIGRHGVAVDSIAEEASQSGKNNVSHHELKPGAQQNSDYSDQSLLDTLNRLAHTEPPPAVVNLSLGFSPADMLDERLSALQGSFEKRYGKMVQWSAATQANYKSQVSTLVNDTTADFARQDKSMGVKLRAAINALVDKGVTVVVAAGNEGKIYQQLADLGITLPPGFDRGFMYNNHTPPGVIVVGASVNGKPVAGHDSADFTRPSTQVDVATDGVDYEYGDGTSLAAPQVAGLAADILAVNPALKPADVEAIIKQSASAVPGEEATLGAGIINRKRALELAANWKPAA